MYHIYLRLTDWTDLTTCMHIIKIQDVLMNWSEIVCVRAAFRGRGREGVLDPLGELSPPPLDFLEDTLP